MKKCSYCGRENAEDALTCNGCGKALEIPPKTTPSSNDLIDPALSPVVVGTFGSLQEASMMVGRLEASGIEAWVPEEYGAGVFSGVIGIESLTVRVAAKDYEAAREVLAASAPPEQSPEPPAAPESGTRQSEDGGGGAIPGRRSP